VYYANQTLCDSTVNVHAGYPERAKDESGLMKAWQSPFILLVDRGGCTFVKKVRNAQRAGAAAVLVADDTCMCSFPDCKPDREGEPCEMEEPIMADDGSGSDISIPAFLLFKQDADPIRDALKQNTQVVFVTESRRARRVRFVDHPH
jgi:PA domain